MNQIFTVQDARQMSDAQEVQAVIALENGHPLLASHAGQTRSAEGFG